MTAPGEEAYTGEHPVVFTVDYPADPRNRVTVFFRIFTVLPIAVVFMTVSGAYPSWGGAGGAGAAGGLLFLGPLLMILFRQKYPRWWFDWNLNLLRFENRVAAYLFLLRDDYPATDAEQAVHLRIPYPDASRLNRWLPLVKWFLAIPHYVVLIFLDIGMVVAVVVGWFAVLATGRLPQVLFDYVVGVLRWSNRVIAYAFLLSTDSYPPFRLGP
ncbi:DUF4389 domain-containing protein [Protofrankia symbiont of Coriaria ruscifolia]|uniref:DUF4389 domain-containing protein n=1 Tax=Protofrankia symbiont of Coriaria ruscifolia TaxID=1306542 RepID=UPI001041112A|nr:DUF4389 domain-containing protein [Protofrankia symbiont of Coriaria ruscifolia]